MRYLLTMKIVVHADTEKTATQMGWKMVNEIERRGSVSTGMVQKVEPA